MGGKTLIYLFFGVQNLLDFRQTVHILEVPVQVVEGLSQDLSGFQVLVLGQKGGDFLGTVFQLLSENQGKNVCLYKLFYGE